MTIFHLLAPGEWPESGEYRPPSLATEGFVHFSFAAQVAGSANLHYAGAPELLVVEVDDAGLDVRVENGFPHVYGPIPAAAARTIRPLRRGPDGSWVTDGGAGAPASPDR